MSVAQRRFNVDHIRSGSSSPQPRHSSRKKRRIDDSEPNDIYQSLPQLNEQDLASEPHHPIRSNKRRWSGSNDNLSDRSTNSNNCGWSYCNKQQLLAVPNGNSRQRVVSTPLSSILESSSDTEIQTQDTFRMGDNRSTTTSTHQAANKRTTKYHQPSIYGGELIPYPGTLMRQRNGTIRPWGSNQHPCPVHGLTVATHHPSLMPPPNFFTISRGSYAMLPPHPIYATLPPLGMYPNSGMFQQPSGVYPQQGIYPFPALPPPDRQSHYGSIRSMRSTKTFRSTMLVPYGYLPPQHLPPAYLPPLPPPHLMPPGFRALPAPPALMAGTGNHTEVGNGVTPPLPPKQHLYGQRLSSTVKSKKKKKGGCCAKSLPLIWFIFSIIGIGLIIGVVLVIFLG